MIGLENNIRMIYFEHLSYRIEAGREEGKMLNYIEKEIEEIILTSGDMVVWKKRKKASKWDRIEKELLKESSHIRNQK